MTQYGFSLPTNPEIENDGEESYIQWTGDKSGNQLGVSPQVLDEVIDSLVDATIAFKLDDGGSLSAYTNMETVVCAELGNRLRILCNVEGGQNTKIRGTLSSKKWSKLRLNCRLHSNMTRSCCSTIAMRATQKTLFGP